jgi:hypothetical protein
LFINDIILIKIMSFLGNHKQKIIWGLIGAVVITGLASGLAGSQVAGYASKVTNLGTQIANQAP